MQTQKDTFVHAENKCVCLCGDTHRFKPCLEVKSRWCTLRSQYFNLSVNVCHWELNKNIYHYNKVTKLSFPCSSSSKYDTISLLQQFFCSPSMSCFPCTVLSVTFLTKYRGERCWKCTMCLLTLSDGRARLFPGRKANNIVASIQDVKGSLVLEFLLFSCQACLFLSRQHDVVLMLWAEPSQKPISTGMKSPALICCSDKGQTADCMEWALSHYARHETARQNRNAHHIKAATYIDTLHV